MFRIGQGFDVHPFAEGRKLIMGGVHIPFEKGLNGHSDADVLVHAIMDSLMGALALGDIGGRFPNNDPLYRGAGSLDLLADLYSDNIFLSWEIANIDSVIVAEEPKFAPFAAQMRENISRTLGITTADISIKATTTEKMGFCGRGEGIAAMATILLAKKQDKGAYKNEKNFSRVRSGGFQRQGDAWKNDGRKTGHYRSPSFPERSDKNGPKPAMGYQRDFRRTQNGSSQSFDNGRNSFRDRN
jgi:2-C-methyl-D-erythritol 2,4-cyclodiphosphate synthase